MITPIPLAAAEAKAAWSTMRADRRFLWFWLFAATALSVAGNVGHAWLTVGADATRCMAIGWAVAPPGLLMLAIHGLPTLARMLGSDQRDRLLTAVVWGVTIGAFGWSAFGIFGFSTAMGLPTQMAWVAPFVIDLSVFGATRGLVLTAPLAARMNVALAETHLDNASAPASSPSQTAALPGPVIVSGAGLESPHPLPATAGSLTSSAASPPPPSPASAPSSPPPPPGGSSCRVAAGPAPSMPAEPTSEAVALAEHIVASGAVRKPVETVAAILCAAARESRKAVIADHIGVHHSVVTKTLEAAETHRRDQFAAVS